MRQRHKSKIMKQYVKMNMDENECKTTTTKSQYLLNIQVTNCGLFYLPNDFISLVQYRNIKMNIKLLFNRIANYVF